MRRHDFLQRFFILLFLFFLSVSLPPAGWSQLPDSSSVIADTSSSAADSVSVISDSLSAGDSAPAINPQVAEGMAPVPSNLRDLPSPLTVAEKERKPKREEGIFYIILLVAFFLGILRISFPSYFNNLFRVFFNTSLRQNQLTDQLLQSMLPSLFFNLFFFLSGGVYIYLLLGYFGKLDIASDLPLLPLCAGSLMGVYLLKFFWLKFLGWVTGMPAELNSYVFIVYLVNKMIGIGLVPFLPVIAFADQQIVSVAVLVSAMLIGFILMIRFLRSYSLAAARLRVPTLHFILYIIALEIFPLLILIRLAALLLDKKL